MSARAVRGHAGPRQSRGLHHMSDHACRLNLAPGLDQRSRVVPDHDVGSSDKRDESRLCRDPARVVTSTWKETRPCGRYEPGIPLVRPLTEFAVESFHPLTKGI